MRLKSRPIFAASVALAASMASTTAASAQLRRPAMPAIHHVFVIVLENQGFDPTFDAH